MSRWPLVLGLLASLFICIRASNPSPYFGSIEKRFKVWPPVREKKELDEMDDARMARERLANGQMLKQPLLRFDILWRKFSGKRRQDSD